MISDEPDEDADTLDDDAAMESFLDEALPRPNGGASSVAEIADWPERSRREVELKLDADTLAWFKARHADWRGEIRCVLRGWVAARDEQRPTLGPTAIIAPDGQPEDRA